MAGIVEVEDLLGTQLVLASVGVATPPKLADRYDILELRGRGARGLVCRVRDLKLGRDVAVKLYPALADTSAEAEVIAEARTLARLEHPNVVRVLDFGRAELVLGERSVDVVYLCMDFIDGRSLRTWRAEKRWSSARMFEVLGQAAEGLAAAHGAGVIHRDFKPENVMIDVRGRARVVDFGLARTKRDAAGGEDAATIEREHAELASGTIEYMAPEVRRGVVDAKSDQFSFAATAWECLTGQLPFDGRQYDWRTPGTMAFVGADALAPAVREVLERGLAYFPDQRYPSVVAMMQALGVARGARRRVVAGVLAGIGLVGVAAGGWYVTRHVDELPVVGVDAPEPAARSLEPARACDAVVGKWRLETTVSNALQVSKFDDVRGWYALDIRRADGDCKVSVEATKLGDSGVGSYGKKAKVGSTTTTVEVMRDGGVSIAFNVDLTQTGKAFLKYRFDLELREGRLYGDWYLAAPEPLRGFVHGVAADGKMSAAAWEPLARPSSQEHPCPSQCRVLCADLASAQRCARDQCADRGRGAIMQCAAR
jgi:tRNA A-37 threonylcarbamoyl transferase component Bud32